MILLAFLSLAAQAGTGQGFCVSESSAPVVYFSPIFETGLNPKVPEYLKGRFGVNEAFDGAMKALPQVAPVRLGGWADGPSEESR